MKTIVALTTWVMIAACTSQQPSNVDSVQDLPQWKNQTIQEMIKSFGLPVEEHEYTVGTAPTKSWNHGIIFSAYPKEEAENREVVIKEFAWTQGEYRIRACCHLVKKAWLVIGAMKIHKDVQF